LRDADLRDWNRRREAEFPGEQDGLRDAICHDDRVDFLGYIRRHLAPSGPALDEGAGIAFPQDAALDLDETDDRLGGMIVRGEAEVDGGLAVTEF